MRISGRFLLAERSEVEADDLRVVEKFSARARVRVVSLIKNVTAVTNL
jgi:hypothetical protein